MKTWSVRVSVQCREDGGDAWRGQVEATTRQSAVRRAARLAGVPLDATTFDCDDDPDIRYKDYHPGPGLWRYFDPENEYEYDVVEQPHTLDEMPSWSEGEDDDDEDQEEASTSA